MIVMVPLKRLKWEVNYEDVSEKTSYIVTLEKEGEDMLVSWAIHGELGYNPVIRYFSLVMEDVWGPELEKGLQNLKELIEN